MEALSKAKAKLIRSLGSRKGRLEEGLFVVEGKKMVQEALQAGWELLYAVVQKGVDAGEWDLETFVATADDMKAISSLDHPEGVLAVCKMPGDRFFQRLETLHGLPYGKGFWLDGIQDPGNLGTIIRIADWFGFHHVICKEGSVDCFNPKALRASMGSIFRVKLIYLRDFEDAALRFAKDIYVADMQGQSIHETTFSHQAQIMLGNESQGISAGLRAAPLQRITIPQSGGAESLNVAITAGIFAFQASQSR